MSIKIWPFFISRNSYLDYRTIVAPDFICEAKISNLLARAAEGELTEKGKGFIRHIIGSKVGDFTIAFRVINAIEKDIDMAGANNILKDQFGRKIEIFEGIVAEGIIKNLAISDRDFEDIHHQLTGKYQEFWVLVEPFPAFPSQPCSLDVENVTSPIRLEKLADLDLTPQPPVLAPSESPNPTPNSTVKFWVTIVLILMAVLGLLFGNILSTKNILLGCATTLEEKIEFEPGDNKISEYLNKERKKYPEKANIYLSGYFKIESPKNIEYKESPIKSKTQPTIKLSKGNRLELNYHPIDLAIADIKNQRVNDKSTINLRIIDRSGCK